MHYWQLGESHYWGHNAIIRVEPFMQPLRAGAAARARGGLAGRDPVARFRRGGADAPRRLRRVARLDLGAATRRSPPNLLDELQRDRRWCQGNLQNLRLFAEPGLPPAHRAVFVTGVMAYLSAPLWLAFLALGTALRLAAVRLAREPAGACGCWTLALLIMPRVLGVAGGGARRAAAFGGIGRLRSVR